MKKHFLLLLSAALLLLSSTACDDALDTIGSDVIGSEFDVTPKTLPLNSAQDDYIGKMFYKSDTLLLGEFNDSRYGNIKATVLAEMFPLAGDVIKPTIDTKEGVWSEPKFTGLVLSMTKNHFGFAPAQQSFYMNVYHKADSLEVDSTYLTDFTEPPLSKFFSEDSLMGRQEIAMNDTLIKVALSTELAEKLGNRLFETALNSPEDFKDDRTFRREFFKGIYLSTNGENVIFSPFNIKEEKIFTLELNYEYTTLTTKDGSARPDTIPNKTGTFHIDTSSSRPKAQVLIGNINLDRLTDETYRFVSSPAGLHPSIEIDLAAIDALWEATIDPQSGGNLMLNRAAITIKAVDEKALAESGSLLPATVFTTPSALLLVKKEEADAFLKAGKTVDDKTSFAASRIGNKYEFDIARYVQQKKDNNEMTGTETFVLIPINSTTSVREKIGLSGLTFDKDSVKVDFIFNQLNQ
jgi:hypothetical protein